MEARAAAEAMTASRVRVRVPRRSGADAIELNSARSPNRRDAGAAFTVNAAAVLTTTGDQRKAALNLVQAVALTKIARRAFCARSDGAALILALVYAGGLERTDTDTTRPIESAAEQ